jgi:hypothetical protein
MADCCDRIATEMLRLQAYSVWDNQNVPPQFIDIFNTPPAFVPMPGGVTVPTLSELLNRLQTPLNVGWGEWWWYNYAQPGKTMLYLPQTPVSTRTRVALNSVRLNPVGDYTLSGATLTFVYPLSVGDLVWVKSYGA